MVGRGVRGWTLAAVGVAVLALAGCVVGCGARAAPVAEDPVVSTRSGPVRGTEAAGLRTFQGIPFAAPPIGEARWQAPQPVEPWREPRDARTPAPMCIQSPHDPIPGPQSEDCLYLNVTAPSSARPDKPAPVVVWLYGGGFYQGNAAEYHAGRLAGAGDVVVVTPSYRLGIFGFLRLPGLPDAGAFGLHDQQTALRWVRDNIRSFGGDPGNVTLAGESAGSMSTCGHLTSPSAAGLFHKAVMQSGTCLVEWPPYPAEGRGYTPYEPPAAVEATSTATAAELGCGVPAEVLPCLRGKSTAELAERMYGFSPSYGSSVLPEDPAMALRDGRFHHVPVMVGTTRDEARSSITGEVPSPLPPDAYRELLAEEFGADAAAVAAEYPPVEGDNGPSYAQIHTDRTWAYTTEQALDAFSARVPTYGFEFADREAPLYEGMVEKAFPYGAYHGSDVVYLFDIGGVEAAFTDDQRRLAAEMVGYWARFAHTGDPNGPGPPGWPEYGAARHVQSLAPGAGGIGAAAYSTEHRLAFWRALHGTAGSR
ncbi:carboxylesterase/lipase family protein [Pseudonocardia sp. TRM90224]|uniref:carboxylesterase/lipase family protein n=1 Tax=Pseudonocardia sp. TRM90224 TaxID=2812678 RepID=UPI001E4F914F|nr:carboxylesterase family protein [Pseudonocardia sp. TRM90224]